MPPPTICTKKLPASSVMGAFQLLTIPYRRWSKWLAKRKKPDASTPSWPMSFGATTEWNLCCSCCGWPSWPISSLTCLATASGSFQPLPSLISRAMTCATMAGMSLLAEAACG